MKRLFTKKGIKITIIIFVIFVLLISGVLGWLGGFLSRMATPIFSYAYERSITAKNWIDVYHQPAQLIEINNQLVKENAVLKEKLYQVEQYKIENDRLKSLIGYQRQIQFESITARIVSRWDYGGETVLTIDKGENEGIEVDNLVIDENGVLVGKISKVGRTLSHIQLLTHPDFKIAVKRLSEIEPLGILSGEFLISGKVDLIPQDSDISSGEELFTTNLQGAVEGIRVGKVTKVNSEPGALFKSAVVSPLYKIENIKFLQVLKKYND